MASPGALEPAAEHAAPAGEAAAADGPREGEQLAFEFQLDVFRGPLDLLLHLIERRELDITAVSLVTVTEQYMEYVRRGSHIDLNALAEFVGVGARLLLLKSRALLPLPPELDPDDEDGNPEALLEALREYRRFKLAAEQLETLDREPRRGYRREAAPPPAPLPTGLDGVDMDALFAVLREILAQPTREQAPDKPIRIPRPQVSLRRRLAAVVERLEREPVLSFRALVGEGAERLAVIVDFLAVLELMKAGYVEARQHAAFADIELHRRPNVEPPPFARIAEDYDGV